MQRLLAARSLERPANGVGGWLGTSCCEQGWVWVPDQVWNDGIFPPSLPPPSGNLCGGGRRPERPANGGWGMARDLLLRTGLGLGSRSSLERRNLSSVIPAPERESLRWWSAARAACERGWWMARDLLLRTGLGLGSRSSLERRNLSSVIPAPERGICAVVAGGPSGPRMGVGGWVGADSRSGAGMTEGGGGNDGEVGAAPARGCGAGWWRGGDARCGRWVTRGG